MRCAPGPARRATTSPPDCSSPARSALRLPQPGAGQTWHRWSLLAAAAEGDLSAARILEAHSDALAILAEAGESDADDAAGTWGVFAAEAPDQRLDARVDGPMVRLSGTKPWCSLGGVLDHALVTAHVGDARCLYAVDLRQPSVRADPPQVWVARGLANITSGPRALRRHARAGGRVAGVVPRTERIRMGRDRRRRLLVRRARSRCPRSSPMRPANAAVSCRNCTSGRSTRSFTPPRQPCGRPPSRSTPVPPMGPTAHCSRCACVLSSPAPPSRCSRQVGHALGPAPLAFDAEHARRVADLTLYVRQHHAERDLAALGAAVLERIDGDGR